MQRHNKSKNIIYLWAHDPYPGSCNSLHIYRVVLETNHNNCPLVLGQ